MKILGIAFCLCLITIFAFADVEAEIVAKDIDANGNIRIWTCYKIDGVEVESQYPKINGKFVYATRFAAHNFAGMTDEQIEKAILYQSKIHGRTLTEKEFKKKTISTNDDIFDNHLKNLVGKTVLVESAEIRIDDTTIIEVKTDGTHTEKIITP